MFTRGAASVSFDAFSLVVVFVTVVMMGVVLAIALILTRVVPSVGSHGWRQLVDTKVRSGLVRSEYAAIRICSTLFLYQVNLFGGPCTRNKAPLILSWERIPRLDSGVRDHTSDWLRKVLISGLGQTMNACSRVFVEDISGDHVVSCARIIGIKHRHNVVRDTLVDICYRYEISAGLDVCVNLTGSSPLTQTGMADFIPGQAVIDVVQRKHGKYMTKCAAIGYGFFSFFFLFFGGIRGRRGYIAKADPEVLRGLGHWGT
ncbi:hypothetical protein Tco_0649571 [Tanacetum coccineum]